MKPWLYIQDIEKDLDNNFIGLYFLNFRESFFLFFFVNSYNYDMVDLKRHVL